MSAPNTLNRWARGEGRREKQLATLFCRLTLLLSPLTLLTMAAQAAQIPSTAGWYPIPNTNISPLCPPYSDIQSIEGCKAVMADWSGGLFDTKRNRFIIHGGGHNGYYGNEIYAIDLNANPIAAVLVQDASHGAGISNVTSCPEVYSDGNPVAVHSYSGLLYIPTLDRYLRYSGSRSNCGFFGGAMWQYDPTGLTWTQITLGSPHPNPGNDGSTPTMAYDPASDAVYLNQQNSGVFWKYDVNTHAFTQLRSGSGTNQPCPALDVSADIDTSRNFYVCVGSGWLDKVSLVSPYPVTRLTATGCDALKNVDAPGWAYYPQDKTFVGWAGGNTVYIYDPASDSCSTVTSYTGGPTTIQANGTYGRFRYSPVSGVFIVANDINSNAYALRLSSGTSPPPSPCDVNGDGSTNVADVQLEVNMALGISSCTNASGTCNVVSVQRIVNAALGGACVSP